MSDRLPTLPSPPLLQANPPSSPDPAKGPQRHLYCVSWKEDELVRKHVAQEAEAAVDFLCK